MLVFVIKINNLFIFISELQSLNLDSPSKQSYVGSYYQPPEKLSRPLYMNTATHPQERKSSGVQDISPQLYQTVPDAGSRGKLSY